MSKGHDIVCAVELGSAKITVLVGSVDLATGQVEIIGRSTERSAGSVVKGEICDMDSALAILGKALDDADRSCGHALAECQIFITLVTGCGIMSRPGVGNVFIRNPERVVTEEDMREAAENAKLLSLAKELEIINVSETYFLIDGRRVSNPLNQSALKLETHIHLVHGISSRIDNFRRAVRNFGFDDALQFILFAPLAADVGVLSDMERENGIVLIDIGAGCTDYVVEYDRGVYTSGVLQVGFDHVANDLAIAFDLHIDVFRRLLESGQLEQAVKAGQQFLEFSNGTAPARRIAVSEIETVIECRLREIFEIIRARIDEAGVPRCLGAGGILTGGGAKFYMTPEIFREVFQLSVQVRSPNVGGAVTGLDDPAYSAVWGALKFAGSCYLKSVRSGSGTPLDGVVGTLNNMLDSSRQWLRQLTKTVKF